MGYQNLGDFVVDLEARGELLRISEELSPAHEIAAALSYLDRYDDRAAYFSRVKGYRTPVVGNLLGSRARIERALGLAGELPQEFMAKIAQNLPPQIVDSSPAWEEEHEGASILEVIPALTHHAGDGGPYFTTAVVVAKCPLTGRRGMGVHRVQIQGERQVGVFLATPPVATFCREAARLGVPLDFALVLGVAPTVFLAAIAWLPEGQDKFEAAGALLGEPLRMVKGRYVNLEYPADAEFVLEGQFLPGEYQEEGPFGESSGYYLTYQNPVGRIRAIFSRRSPIYHALQTFTKENSLLLSVMWEASELGKIVRDWPQIRRARLYGVMGEHAVVQIRREGVGRVKEIMKYILERYPYIKGVVAVDEDVDIANEFEIHWAVGTRFQPHTDLLILSDLEGSVIDPSAKNFKTSKWAFDCTVPPGEEKHYERIRLDPAAWERVASVLDQYFRGPR